MVDQNSQFYAILTSVGAAKQANADAMGIPWKITQMGVGDANGTDPTPNATQTALLNEWRRAPLNQLKVDDKDSAIIVAEQVIPAEVGGHWIREIGLYDADGDLVAVANCAPTYKPLLNQGSGRTQVVRMSLVVSSSSNVQLKIDPSVVLATREFVTEELARQDFKHSVLVATTGPITLSGLQTVEGVALQAGNRVLVKDQAAAKDNGLYLVAAGAWVRSADADTSAKVTAGLLVLVERGNVNGDSAWQLVTDGPITLGVTALAFEMAFGRTGVAAGTYRSVTVDKYGRVIAATNPTTVAGYGLTDVFTKAEVTAALAAKAPLESPTFTGVVQVPTAVKGNSSLQAASTAFVQGEITSLINGSPGALDTLKELADAMGNDPNFATTVLNGLGTKADKATTLAGYGITDDVQIRGQKSVGAFTVECLDTTDSGTIAGILIKTKIPAADGVMAALTIKGALNSYTSPFEAQLCWYYYENAIYQPQVLVSGAGVGLDSLFNVHLSVSAGLINIRLDFGVNVYLPRLMVTAYRDRVFGGNLAHYQGWTSTPYAAAISGEVKAYRVATLTTANIHSAASGLAKTGMLPVGNVTGLPEALLGKAPTAHTHAMADITGLDAALRAASGLAQGALDQDPNLAVSQVILTNHPNVPIPGFYWHITTTFFNFVASNANRSQIAVQYDGGCAVFVRSIYNTMGGWTKWRRLDNQVPAGTIVYWPGYTPPPGYLKANGALISRTTYAELFAAISTFGGAGDGSTTFNVPDLRGEFIRGYDDGRGVDINRALGSVQFSQNLSHIHTGYAALAGVHSHNINMGGNDVAGYRPAITAPGADGVMTAGALSWEGAHTHELVINADGGNESRPRNMALLACIKY